MSSPDDKPAPVGEEIHLPGPTALPALTALGITLALIGLTFHWSLIVVGSFITVLAVGRWIGDTRREIDALPLEHRR